MPALPLSPSYRLDKDAPNGYRESSFLRNPQGSGLLGDRLQVFICPVSCAATVLGAEQLGRQRLVASRFHLLACPPRCSSCADAEDAEHAPSTQDMVMAECETGDAVVWPLFGEVRLKPRRTLQQLRTALFEASKGYQVRARHTPKEGSTS